MARTTASSNLPIHPTKRHPLTGEPLQAIYVRSDGRVFWPIMGGAEGGDGQGGSGGDGSGQGGSGGEGSGGSSGNAGRGGSSDLGFPADTPVEQMTATQQAAYYKNHAQKWQGRAQNSYGLLGILGVQNEDDAKAAKQKLTQHSEFERELMTEHEQKVADARTEGQSQARNEMIPELVRARFEGAAKGNIDDDKLDDWVTRILEPLDITKFLTEDGKKVDTAKVKAYVANVAPGKGNTERRTGPTASGQGKRSGSDSGGTPQERAKARLERLGVKTAQ